MTSSIRVVNPFLGDVSGPPTTHASSITHWRPTGHRSTTQPRRKAR